MPPEDIQAHSTRGCTLAPRDPSVTWGGANGAWEEPDAQRRVGEGGGRGRRTGGAPETCQCQAAVQVQLALRVPHRGAGAAGPGLAPPRVCSRAGRGAPGGGPVPGTRPLPDASCDPAGVPPFLLGVSVFGEVLPRV